MEANLKNKVLFVWKVFRAAKLADFLANEENTKHQKSYRPLAAFSKGPRNRWEGVGGLVAAEVQGNQPTEGEKSELIPETKG